MPDHEPLMTEQGQLATSLRRCTQPGAAALRALRAMRALRALHATTAMTATTRILRSAPVSLLATNK